MMKDNECDKEWNVIHHVRIPGVPHKQKKKNTKQDIMVDSTL